MLACFERHASDDDVNDTFDDANDEQLMYQTPKRFKVPPVAPNTPILPASQSKLSSDTICRYKVVAPFMLKCSQDLSLKSKELCTLPVNSFVDVYNRQVESEEGRLRMKLFAPIDKTQSPNPFSGGNGWISLKDQSGKVDYLELIGNLDNLVQCKVISPLPLQVR